MTSNGSGENKKLNHEHIYSKTIKSIFEYIILFLFIKCLYIRFLISISSLSESYKWSSEYVLGHSPSYYSPPQYNHTSESGSDDDFSVYIVDSYILKQKMRGGSFGNQNTCSSFSGSNGYIDINTHSEYIKIICYDYFIFHV